MKRKILSLLALLATCVVTDVFAENSPRPFVSPMFGDNMVLQRGKPNTIWGWSKPRQVVKIEIAGRVSKTITDASGKWQMEIQPPAPGGPYTVKIDGAEHVELHEVLVGDVWFCGGQSNMQLGLERTRNGEEEIKSANHPEIRIFMVGSHAAYSASEIPQGKWKICSPQSVSEDGGFSAVAYYYGKKLQEELHVPVGLVEDCLGGTPAEAWTSAETLRCFKEFDPQLAEMQKFKAQGGPEYGNYIMHWYDEYDVGIKGGTFANLALLDTKWKTVMLPGNFQELGVGEVPCVCWLRKTVTLPNPLPTGKAFLRLGVVERMDTTFVNGKWIGASAWVENSRNYEVKDGILKPGKNLLTVRVFKTKKDGGFMSKGDELKLVLGDGLQIPLAGDWKGAVTVDATPPHPMPLSFENWPVMPSVLYQGMLQPVAPLAITGFIWYQGEANAAKAWQYRKLLPAMIGDWRKLFGQGDLPFYIVSLPAFMQHQEQPNESSWAELREAQALTAHRVKNSALAVTIDTGEADNIHPQDKLPVAERLALCALAKNYGMKIPFEGPTFKSLQHSQGGLKLKFDHIDGGLVVKGDKLGEFSIAGKDHKWVWADAKIEGDSIIVSSPEVAEPVAARYAWQSFPKATLFNGAGLPAVPFRTDDWPVVTEPH